MKENPMHLPQQILPGTLPFNAFSGELLLPQHLLLWTRSGNQRNFYFRKSKHPLLSVENPVDQPAPPSTDILSGRSTTFSGRR
ncbi:MAG: hypothetical protein IPP46_07680 [Bacteroidetes bacterium]|nr:hypothetical protein [Bacteroidota bacterium]